MSVFDLARAALNAPDGRADDDMAASGDEMQAIAAAIDAGEAAERAKNGAYHERDQVVALVARMALALGWRAGLARHVDKPGDPPWEDDWRNIVFVELPTGQASWHLHDSEMPLFVGLPAYPSPWDGHDTATKYERVAACVRGQP